MLGQEALIHLLTRAYPRQNKVEKYKKIGLTINLKGKSENPGQSIVFKHKKITEWYAANGVQFPWSVSYQISDYFDYSIADENDLRNAKEGKALNTLQNNTTFDNAHSKGSYT